MESECRGLDGVVCQEFLWFSSVSCLQFLAFDNDVPKCDFLCISTAWYSLSFLGSVNLVFHSS